MLKYLCQNISYVSIFYNDIIDETKMRLWHYQKGMLIFHFPFFMSVTITKS
jgi:hypothetical protein